MHFSPTPKLGYLSFNISGHIARVPACSTGDTLKFDFLLGRHTVEVIRFSIC